MLINGLSVYLALSSLSTFIYVVTSPSQKWSVGGEGVHPPLSLLLEDPIVAKVSIPTLACRYR